MKLSFFNEQAGIRMDDPSKNYTHDEALLLVRELKHSNTGLITTLPSGVGLDFHVHEDKSIWIEFYADDGLHSATVSLPVAEQVFQRAYVLPNTAETKQSFADIILEWDY